MSIDYRNTSGRTTSAEVPLGLAKQGPRPYLLCRYEGYENERSLALHRVLSARVSKPRLKQPAGFDLVKYDADGRFGYGNGEKIRMTFSISHGAGLHILESPLSHDQTVVEHDKHYDISATVVDSGQLEWWLLSFGDEVWGVTQRAVVPTSTMS